MKQLQKEKRKTQHQNEKKTKIQPEVSEKSEMERNVARRRWEKAENSTQIHTHTQNFLREDNKNI